MIVFECFLDRLRYAQVQVGWNVKVSNRGVGLLHFFNPNIKLVRLNHQHALKVDFRRHQGRDESREQREESQATKFKCDTEYELCTVHTRIVTITDSCQDGEDPVERKDVHLMRIIIFELLITAAAIAERQSLQHRDPAVRLGAQSYPDAGHDMSKQKSGREKHDQLEHITSLLCDGAFHEAVDKFLERSEHLANVCESKEF